MNALEKLAAKGSLIAQLKMLLYGEKPATVRRILGGLAGGGALGGALGAVGGGVRGARTGQGRAFRAVLPGTMARISAKEGPKSHFVKNLLGHAGAKRIGRNIQGGAGIGAGVGGALGAGAGALRARGALKAYAKRRRSVNIGLGAGATGGLAGLAALLGKKNR